ncbi:DUF1501 domain-containing protein [Myxococcus sp. K38C18041901]|uniref:DUF1501 domain-containing protein n=1 Tax=Myxococcus guangdongensis TaxID=2906760 RepID=UPI0020A7BE1C|nr:DUF1501 domain-containing protein [Myxococcus guangdongensis]MCP3060355.1 DUF1501 domain-containing protein [Myxococcus guangdongensis]
MGFSRRQFLRNTSLGLGALSVSSTFPRWLGDAAAATLSGYAGYRATVCVFLLGGNDANNVLVPRANLAHGQYLDARSTLGIPLADLRVINPVGMAAGAYGLHPSLAKLQALFEAEKAAFVCNVGPLTLPMRKQDYEQGTVARPDNLFSHSDQQDAWASDIANPSTVDLPPLLEDKVTGWGGRTADRLHGLNPGDYPEVTSFGGKALFTAGAERQPLMVSPSGELGLTPHPDADFDALRTQALEDVVAIHNGVTLEASYGGVFTTAQTFSAARAAARQTAWGALRSQTQGDIAGLFTPPAGTSGWTLPLQLFQVVQDLVAGAMPATRGGLGVRRQMFSVGLGGFDTHAGQDTTHAALLAQLDFALDAFQQAMTLLKSEGVFGASPPQATLFTMSDFGRTLAENGERGTDHGWGSHAIVVGDRVQGRRLHGVYPNLDLLSGGVNNPDSVDGRGRWLPSLCVGQYGFTFASWLGLGGVADRDHAFPNLSAYVAAATTGGFPAAARAYRIPFLIPDP